jgi:hypothetical protein
MKESIILMQNEWSYQVYKSMTEEIDISKCMYTLNKKI